MPGFLIDENLSPVIVKQVGHLEAAIEIKAVGQPGAPAHGTLDPEILLWLQQHDYFLVTNNRTSIPGHLRDHLAKGGRVAGIFIVPIPSGIGQIVADIYLIWAASRPGEYDNQVVYLPL